MTVHLKGEPVIHMGGPLPSVEAQRSACKRVVLPLTESPRWTADPRLVNCGACRNTVAFFDAEMAARVAEILARGHKAPIPLSDSTGKVFTYACPRCLQIPSGSHAMRREVPTAEVLSSRFGYAAGCCICACGKVARLGGWECGACSARVQKERAESAAIREQVEEARTDAENETARLWETTDRWTPGEKMHWPVSIIQGRDGMGPWLALPVETSEIPSDLGERVECMTWLDAHGDAPIGFGETPQAAYDALVVKVVLRRAAK